MAISGDQWSSVVLHMGADAELRAKFPGEEWNQILSLLDNAPTLAVIVNNFLYFHTNETPQDEKQWEEFLDFAGRIALKVQDAITP